MKFRRLFYLVGGLSMLAGAFLLITSFMTVNFDFRRLSPIPKEYKTYEYDFTSSIDINFRSEKVVIKENSESQTIKVSLYENEYEKSISKILNDTLLISKVDNTPWYKKVIGTDFYSSTITVELPKNLIIEDFKLYVSSGRVEIYDITANKLSVSVNSGSTFLKNINAKSLSASAQSGKITAEKVEAEYLYFNAKSGSIKISDVVGDEIKIEAKSGSIRTYQVTADTITFTETSGSIKSYNLTANTIKTDVNSGSTMLEIKGEKTDYTVFVSINSGSSNIQSAMGGNKRLELSATSGNIKVYFK